MSATRFLYYVLLVSPLLWQHCSGKETLCYKCDNVFQPALCMETTVCAVDEACYVERGLDTIGATKFYSGCVAQKKCPTEEGGHFPIEQCLRCCLGNLCNIKGCGSLALMAENQLACFTCNDASDPKDCHMTSICSRDQVCGSKIKAVSAGFKYDLECLDSAACSNPNMQCCDSNGCNFNLTHALPVLVTTLSHVTPATRDTTLSYVSPTTRDTTPSRVTPTSRDTTPQDTTKAVTSNISSTRITPITDTTVRTFTTRKFTMKRDTTMTLTDTTNNAQAISTARDTATFTRYTADKDTTTIFNSPTSRPTTSATQAVEHTTTQVGNAITGTRLATLRDTTIQTEKDTTTLIGLTTMQGVKDPTTPIGLTTRHDVKDSTTPLEIATMQDVKDTTQTTTSALSPSKLPTTIHYTTQLLTTLQDTTKPFTTTSPAPSVTKTTSNLLTTLLLTPNELTTLLDSTTSIPTTTAMADTTVASTSVSMEALLDISTKDSSMDGMTMNSTQIPFQFIGVTARARKQNNAINTVQPLLQQLLLLLLVPLLLLLLSKFLLLHALYSYFYY